MAIQWSSTNGHMRVGMEVVRSSITVDTTSITIRVDYYVQSRAWGYSDDQTLVASGKIDQNFNYKFSTATGSTTTKKVGSASFKQSISYDGGPTLSFRARVTGAYDGSAPDLTISYKVPARPADVPDKVPTPTMSGITSTYLVVNWAAPASNGSAINTYQVQLDDSSSFSSPLHDANSTDRSEGIGGLSPYTNYYARVRAHNGKGWGPWSAVKVGRTAAAAPTSVRSLTAKATSTSAIAVSWAAPADLNGASITQYVVQWSVNSNFSGASTRTVGASTLSTSLTGLASAKKYYVRVRADNSAGQTWSGGVSTTTWTTPTPPPPPPDTGWQVLLSGIWEDATPYVKVNNVWQAVTTYLKENNAWVKKG